MTNNRYEPELKQKVLRLYLEEGRTKKSLTEEYNLDKARWHTGYSNTAKNAITAQQNGKNLIHTKLQKSYAKKLKNSKRKMIF